MKLSRGIIALLLLAACETTPSHDNPPPRPRFGGDDVKDHQMPLTAAEPPWRDLVRHTLLPFPGKAMHPGPSPDGSFFAYATTEFGPKLQIAIRETYDASPLQITANGGDNMFPRVSPDGKLVAYASNREGNWDIYVSRIDSPGSVTQITFEPEIDIAPSWSPDAKNPLICFQSVPRTGRSGVWVVRPDGRGLRELVGDKARGWSAINPHFSPDGRWIAYATVNKSYESQKFGEPTEADDIWIVRNDGAYNMRLTDDLSAEWWPAWGGDRVFFVTNKGGMQNICSVRVKPLEDPK